NTKRNFIVDGLFYQLLIEHQKRSTGDKVRHYLKIFS
ncbi:unnamed protein product, partial [Larinioides sclopetarius]